MNRKWEEIQAVAGVSKNKQDVVVLDKDTES